VRKLSVVAIFVSLGIFVGCGGGGSTPAGVPTTVILAPSTGQALAQGGSITITASVTTGSNQSTGVTWSVSGPGSLSSTTNNPVTYTAPASVTANTPVVVTATSTANTTSSSYLALTILPAGATNTNTTAVNVNGGPVPPYPNGVFTTVNICSAGSTTCTDVSGILVDTGSYGLRILQSAIPSLTLPELTDTNNNPIFNCVSFLDGSYLWGPVSEADLRINGEVAGAALVQVISSSNSGIPTACTNGGTENENTPQLLGANGILGIGLEPTDCSLAGENFCDGSLGSVAPVYFDCPNSSCGSGASPVAVSATSQVVNPIVLFNTDNNGDTITMSSITAPQASTTGTLTFGIGTQSNNAIGTATIYTLDSSDNFEVTLDGENLTSSFIDSGSNALFFPNWPGFPICTTNTSFYCPASPSTIAPANLGENGSTGTVSFTVTNADSVISANPGDSVLPNLAGPEQAGSTPAVCSNGTGDCTFDYGFPFFYGRTVFTAIDGQNVSTATPPWFAY
jgi:hypothetical protein